MSHGHHQLDVTHAFTADLTLGDFHTATVADHALVTDSLVLTAVAFPVFHRTENLLAEQTVSFGLQRSVVDGFRFQHLAVRLFQNRIRRCQTDGYFMKLLTGIIIFSESHFLSDVLFLIQI